MSESAKRTVTINISGQKFSIRTDEDERYLNDLQRFINERIDTVRRASGRVETGQIALLAALDIADALFQQKRCNQELRRDVDKRAKAILATIDEMAGSLEIREAVVGARPTARPSTRSAQS